MKKIILVLFIINISVCMFPVSSLYAAAEDDVRLSTQTFFNYLKNGDNAGLLNVLTDPYLSEKKDLFKSEAYRNHLRKIYKNAYMIITNVESSIPDERIVDVDIYFENEGIPLRTRFLLKRITDSWKVAEEIRDIENSHQ